MAEYQIAIFAAGCFWGVEDYFSKVRGVVETEVGYTGGSTANPSYQDVCSDKTGHAEAIRIKYDPSAVSYDELLTRFFKIHDPTALNMQGPDIGSQYRSAIFYLNDDQKKRAENKIRELNSSGLYDKPIVTQLEKAKEFYRAEQYHQKYVEKTGRGACHIAP